MLLSLLSGGDPRRIIVSILLTLPVILFALAFHETAHGYIAYKCGDRTAYNLGRLTLNPIRHMDPIGCLSMLFFGFGWAKPIPINTRNFRNPKRGMALSALAGPMANLIVGVFSAVAAGFFYVLYIRLTVSVKIAMLVTFVYWTFQLFFISAEINLLFMAFNLIPFPPFDGSRIALIFLPTQTYFKIMRYERQIMFGVLIAVMVLSRFGYSPFSWIAETMTNGIANAVIPLFRSILFV
ncbi:MAG: site-2 protease family protein [Ruminococcaceae bacterium]|nr:site-2 protease family protein [Oscillospiraceae bacterium]